MAISRLALLATSILHYFIMQVALAEPCTVSAALFMPLTGPASSVGDDFRKAAQLSFENLSPEIRARLVLSFEDTQLKAQNAVSAFKSVVARRRPDVVAVAFAESTIALAPLAQQEKIPLIGCAPTRGYLQDRPFTFRHWVDAESMSPVLGDEIQRLAVKRVAVVHSEHPAMVDFSQYFSPLLQRRGIDVAGTYSVLPDDTDFRSISAQISRKGVDGVVYFLLPPQPSNFARQFRALNKGARLFSFINTESASEVRNAQGAMEGVIYVGPVFTPVFLSKYAARYDGDYPEICSGNFFDIVQMIGTAVAQGRCSSDEIREHLRTTINFSGAGGQYSVSESREFRLPVELRWIKDGRFLRYPGF